MAEIKNKLFGELSGTFGDIVYRQRNGKNYTSRRPKSYTLPDNEEFLVRSKKFKLSAKIASIINSIEELKNIWNAVKPTSISVYNYLISKNYEAVGSESITGNLQITPDSKVGVRFGSVSKESNRLIVTLQALTEAALIDVTIEKKIKLICLLFMNNPNSSSFPSYAATSIMSVPQSFNLTDSVVFDIMIPTSVDEKFNLYQSRTVYSAIVTFDENDNLVNYSDTFSFDVE